jgi:hypothetical protein
MDRLINNPQGIAGLRGREPVGAALAIGVKKNGNGFPIERDRFHLVAPREEKGNRPYLPQFAAFNTAPPERRQMIRGNLVHASRAECFDYQLKAQVLPGGKAHPNRRPACVGDGVRAVRWTGQGADDFRQITCPNERCEYRQEIKGAKPCKPRMRLLFRIRWPDGNPLPTPLVKLTSGSWNSTANALGFFKHLESIAQHLGISDATLFGYPFLLQLTQQTNAAAKTAFPVLTITPEADPVEFFQHQRERIRALQAPAGGYVAITDQTETDPLVLSDDADLITVPSFR